jgi:cold shock CspA family protein
LEEAMTGIVKTYDPKEFIGTIESNGMRFLVKRNSMRRGTQLREGLPVSFVSVNLSDGANAQQIRPCQEDL